jgi:pyruvate,water dikinase
VFSLIKSILGNKANKEMLTVHSLFQAFRELLHFNNQALDLMADMGEKLGGDYLFDKHYIETIVTQLEEAVYRIVYDLNLITQKEYLPLFDIFEKAKAEIHGELDSRFTIPVGEYVYPLSEITKEMSDYAGDKMATLGELRNRLGLDVPEGFVISTYAFKKFMEYNGLDEGVDDLFAGRFPQEILAAKVHDLRDRLLKAKIPPALEKAIRKVSPARKRSSQMTWALRSSALGEDGQVSYAGQYATVLNLPSSQIGSGYRQVVASLFSPQVIAYRKERPQERQEMAMAVGCVQMISAVASGVMYTIDPTDVEGDRMIVSASWGLGKLVVEGEAEVDQYKISRSLPHSILSQQIAPKPNQYVPAAGGGIVLVPVPREKQEQPSLNEPTLLRIAEGAMRIEQYMRSFQDIEWCIDEEGRVIYLQARPLQFPRKPELDKPRLVKAARNYPVLLKDTGVIASRGIGAGMVFQIGAEEETSKFPRGAVLVLRHTSPRMSEIVPLASAVVTDIGAVTGHMATICREFRVPTIVDTQKATRVLKTGMEVTVDAEENVIYQGIVKELLAAQLIEKTPYEDTYEFKLLRRLLKKVSLLHVTDPQSNEFDPAHCKTFHDIIRFAHEMAVRRIGHGIPRRKLAITYPLGRLKLPIPLDLTVVDIDGGLQRGSSISETPEISIEEIACLPLQTLLQALIAPGVWQSEPVDLDLKGFMSSFTSNRAAQALSSEGVHNNLAIVSREYLNLSLHLGYHFNMVDGNISDDQNANYIYFRFFGGVTEFTRRSRRISLLARILEKNDFAVESKGDLVIGRIKKVGRQEMEKKFRLIGRLIGYTRQLDVLLRSKRDIERFTDHFLEEMRMVESTESGRRPE